MVILVITVKTIIVIDIILIVIIAMLIIAIIQGSNSNSGNKPPKNRIGFNASYLRAHSCNHMQTRYPDENANAKKSPQCLSSLQPAIT